MQRLFQVQKLRLKKRKYRSKRKKNVRLTGGSNKKGYMSSLLILESFMM